MPSTIRSGCTATIRTLAGRRAAITAAISRALHGTAAAPTRKTSPISSKACSAGVLRAGTAPLRTRTAGMASAAVIRDGGAAVPRGNAAWPKPRISYKLPVFDELGRQVSEASKTLNVKIPAGVGDGERIRLKGQGVAGVGGGQNGDLYLVIRLAPHPLFEIDGHNLSIVAPLAPWEAALGASIEVPTLTGKIALTVPAGSQSGKRLRVKGKGLAGKKEPGDLYVILKVVMPPKPNEKASALWRELAEQAAFNPRAEWE